MNHYPRHVGDYLKKTIGLSMIQDGAYTRLIDLYYTNEGPLPLDKTIVYADARCRSKPERDAVDFVLAKYFKKKPDGFHHGRCDDEISRFIKKSAQASESATIRWKAERANAMRTHSDGNASQNQNQNHKPEDQEQRGGAVAPAPPKRSPAKQLPKGWALPDDWGTWAKTERPGWSEADVIRVSLLFRDHWQGKGEARADWEATWRNWVRRERTQFSGGGGTAKDAKRTNVAAEIWKGTRDEKPTEHVIEGESKRVG